MAARGSQTAGEGFTVAERAAMTQRAAELRAEGRAGARRAEGLQAVLEAIAAMEPSDRVLAERVHAAVSEAAPQLWPRTWYGMPTYANADGKVVVCFKRSGKSGTRYSTLEFQDPARLDSGELWPVSFALRAWTPAVAEAVTDLLRAAVS